MKAPCRISRGDIEKLGPEARRALEMAQEGAPAEELGEPGDREDGRLPDIKENILPSENEGNKGPEKSADVRDAAQDNSYLIMLYF